MDRPRALTFLRVLVRQGRRGRAPCPSGVRDRRRDRCADGWVRAAVQGSLLAAARRSTARATSSSPALDAERRGRSGRAAARRRARGRRDVPGVHDAREARQAARGQPLLVRRLADRAAAAPVQGGAEAAGEPVRAAADRRRGRPRQDDRGRDHPHRAERSRGARPRPRRVSVAADAEVAARDARSLPVRLRGPRRAEASASSSRPTSTRPSPEPRRVIASLELMRRAENLEALGTAAPSLDVVIVDEAHHMRNLGTATNDLGEVLDRARRDRRLPHRDAAQPRPQRLLPAHAPARARGVPAARDVHRADRAQRAHQPRASPSARRAGRRDFDDALDALVQASSAPRSAARFTRSGAVPRRARDCSSAAPPATRVDREDVVRCQRDLIELNTLSHVFTRTRKREVQELFPTRRSRTVSVDVHRRGARVLRRRHGVGARDLRRAGGAPRGGDVPAPRRELPARARRAADRRRALRAAHHRCGRGRRARRRRLDGGDALDDALAGERRPPRGRAVRRVERLLATWDAYRGRSRHASTTASSARCTDSFAAGADRILVFSYFTGTIDYLADAPDGPARRRPSRCASSSSTGR